MTNDYTELEFLSTHLQPVERLSVQPSKKTETDLGTLYEYKGKAGSRKFIISKV